MDKIEFKNKFWYYYLELEKEFLEIEKTIPVIDRNSETFSYSYMKLLRLVCSEIDVLFKKFIEYKKVEIEEDNMGEYEKFIKENIDGFITQENICYNFKSGILRIKPYEEWSFNKHLSWWEVYTAIKHNRNEEDTAGIEKYKYANQKNTLNALSALFQLNMFFYKSIIDAEENEDEIHIPLPQSKIFYLNNWGNYFENLISENVYIDYKNGRVRVINGNENYGVDINE